MASATAHGSFQAADADLTTWAGITPGSMLGHFWQLHQVPTFAGQSLTNQEQVHFLAGGDIAAATATTPSARQRYFGSHDRLCAD